MAIRIIREIGDDILKKESRDVTQMTDKLRQLIEDMHETLYDAGGVGLAAVQVGVLKKIILIDTAEEDEDPNPVVMINPKIVDSSGEQTGDEGCLSVPGKAGAVTRPNYVKVLYMDENMEPQEIEGTELLARAICHEIDHLYGHLYVEKVEGELKDVQEEE